MRARNIRSVALAASVAAMVGAAPAFAADVIFQEPPAPAPGPIISTPVSSWAGPYGGLSFGYAFGHTDTSGPAGRITNNGWLVSAFAGFNGQSDQFVYGFEGDVGYNFGHDRGSNYGSQLGFEGSLRARLGYAVSDATLLYITAGGAIGSHRFHDASGNDRHTHIGWTAGAGIDQKLTENVFGRLEYRYTDYGNRTYTTPALGAQTISNNHHRVGLGIGVKF